MLEAAIVVHSNILFLYELLHVTVVINSGWTSITCQSNRCSAWPNNSNWRDLESRQTYSHSGFLWNEDEIGKTLVHNTCTVSAMPNDYEKRATSKRRMLKSTVIIVMLVSYEELH